jgi:fructokinase
MTPGQRPTPKNRHAARPLAEIGKRPAVVGRVGTFSAADNVEFAGRSILNVVWHLHALGFEPLLITRVGNDAEGRQVLHHLENSGVDLEGVQIEDEMPTSGEPATSDRADGPRNAWEKLDWKPAVEIMNRTGVALLFHGVTTADSESIRSTLNTIQTQTGTPYFVDLDLAPQTLAHRDVRRALLGVKWIRADAGHLPGLMGDSEAPFSRSLTNDARSVRSRFALDGVIVEHHGVPVLGVYPDRTARGTVSPPANTSFLPGGRDAAAAALIIGLVLGWPEHAVIGRAAQFAFLAGSTAIAQRVDSFVYSSVLRHWGASEASAVES